MSFPTNHGSRSDQDPEGYHYIFTLSKDFTDLYTSWNACFVFSQMDDLHLLLPKLFIPSQVDAKPHEYIFSRTLVLANVLYFNLFQKLDKVAPISGPSNRKEIALAWGKINRAHAQNYVVKELGKNRLEFQREFEAYFAKRYRNIIKLITGYLSAP